MLPLYIKFTFESISASYETTEAFEDFDDCLENYIDDFVEEKTEELNDNDEGEEFLLTGRLIVDCDSDYMDANGFDDLNEYGAYMEQCDIHGDAYKMRYEDVGEFDFEDQYAGTYRSLDEWAEELCEDIFDLDSIPEFIRRNIDWEGVAQELQYDYDVYDDGAGFHIFRQY